MATITSFSPNPVDVGQILTIGGDGLDSCTQVVFRSRGGSGVTNARPQSKSATQVTVIVPLRSKSGNFYLVTGSGNILAPGMITITDPFAPPPAPPPPPGPGPGPGGAPDPPSGNMTWKGVGTKIWNQFGPAASVGATIAAVNSSRNAASGIGGDIVSGAAALPMAAFSAGTKVALSLLDGVLSILGPSGSSLSSFAHKFVNSLTGALEGGVKLLGNGVKAVAGVAGAGLGALGALGGGIVGAALGGPEGALLGAALGSSAAAAILKSVEGLASALGGIMEGVAKSAGIAFEMVTSALQAVADVLKDTISSALNKARDILQYSQQTGWSLGQSSQAVQTGMAFGVGAGQLSQTNAFAASALSGLYGGSGDGSFEDLRAYRAAYRGMADQGPVGLLLAQGLEGAVGKSGFREAINLDDETFDKTVTRSRGLEMPADQVQKIGQQWQSLVTYAGQFADFVKNTIAEAALPLLTEGLEAAVKYFVANKELIVKSILDFGETVYVLGPKYIGLAVQTMSHIVASGLRWLAGVAGDFANLLEGFDQNKGGFLDTFAAVFKMFDYASVAAKSFVTVFSVIGGVLMNVGLVVGKVALTIMSVVTGLTTWLSDHVSKPILDRIGLKSVAQSANSSLHGVDDVVKGLQKSMANTPFATWQSTKAYLDKIPTTDFSGAIENMKNSGTGANAAKNVRGLQRTLNGAGDKADDFGDSFANRLNNWAGPEDKRQSDYQDKTKGILEKIADNTGMVADNTKPKPPPPGGGRSTVEALLLALSEQLVENSYLQGGR